MEAADIHDDVVHPEVRAHITNLVSAVCDPFNHGPFLYMILENKHVLTLVTLLARWL